MASGVKPNLTRHLTSIKYFVSESDISGGERSSSRIDISSMVFVGGVGRLSKKR